MDSRGGTSESAIARGATGTKLRAAVLVAATVAACEGTREPGKGGALDDCPVRAIAAGDEHTCAILRGARLACWGGNDQGQLGLGDTFRRGEEPGEMGDRLMPVRLGSGRAAMSVRGGWSHTCALLEEGDVLCWGDNDRGQLGLGDAEDRGDEPDEMEDALYTVDLGPGGKAVSLALGWLHTCALLESGRVKCWGTNQNGELGVGDTDNRGDDPGEMGQSLPFVDLGAGRLALGLSAGAGHTCALLDDGTVKCWGWNGDGELGAGDTDNRGDDPGEMGDTLSTVDLGAGAAVLALSAGSGHTCALLGDGAVKCWGWNIRGQLGAGDTEDRGDDPAELGDDLAPIDLGLGEPAVAVASGLSHSCALSASGRVKCWGANDWGKLGLGDTDHRGDDPGEMGESLPFVDLGPAESAIQLAAGTDHTCALLSDGDVKCWGAGYAGQLGLGETDRRGDDPGEMGSALPVVRLCGPSVP